MSSAQKKWEDLTPQEQEAAARWWQSYAACLAAQATASTPAATPGNAAPLPKPLASTAPSPAAAPERTTKASSASAAARAALAPELHPLPPKVVALTPPGAKKHSKYVMAAAGITWEDPSLDEWPESLFISFPSPFLFGVIVVFALFQMTFACLWETLGTTARTRC